MQDPIWLQLGIAAPLVVALLYLLKQNADERKEVTAKFLNALQTTVSESNESRMRSAVELGQVVETLRSMETRSTLEHKQLVESIDRLYLREQVKREGI